MHYNHYMALPVSFRWDEDLIARIDEARGDVSRSKWVRRAVEQALSGAKEPISSPQADRGSVPSSEGVGSAAPAEPTRDQIYWRPDSPEERLLLGRNADSSQSKRDVRPIPKKGER